MYFFKRCRPKNSPKFRDIREFAGSCFGVVRGEKQSVWPWWECLTFKLPSVNNSHFPLKVPWWFSRCLVLILWEMVHSCSEVGDGAQLQWNVCCRVCKRFLTLIIMQFKDRRMLLESWHTRRQMIRTDGLPASWHRWLELTVYDTRLCWSVISPCRLRARNKKWF